MAQGMLLLSGGFDSPVAGWLVKRAGHQLAAVHFGSEPFVGREVEDRCRVIAEKLGMQDFTVIELGKELERLANSGHYRLYYVLQKRLMVGLACGLARKKGCSFLVTGENLGQVSSQTLKNLSVIDAAAELPVARPLISFDKEDIIAIARKIGTYEISKGPEACCALGPKHPATASRLADVLAAEEEIYTVGGKA